MNTLYSLPINTVLSIKDGGRIGSSIIVTCMDGQYTTEWLSFNNDNTRLVGAFYKLPI